MQWRKPTKNHGQLAFSQQFSPSHFIQIKTNQFDVIKSMFLNYISFLFLSILFLKDEWPDECQWHGEWFVHPSTIHLNVRVQQVSLTEVKWFDELSESGAQWRIPICISSSRFETNSNAFIIGEFIISLTTSIAPSVGSRMTNSIN